jgi:hypothetical protein
MTNLPQLIANGYERKARLYPALLLVAPIVIATVAIFSAKLSGFQSLAAALAGCGGAFLLTQLARDAGLKGQAALFAKWGGMPSVVILRHSDKRIDAITKARYHKRLAELVNEAKAPSIELEQANAAAADAVYTAWSNYLRVNTHDTKQYALLFQENVSYGYRRNVWGLRPIGIIVSLICCLACGIRLYFVQQSTGTFDEAVAGAAAFAAILLLLWLFRFTSNWVRVSADAYAERLVECADTLASESVGTKK